MGKKVLAIPLEGKIYSTTNRKGHERKRKLRTLVVLLI
jgi:hypothetical protein